MSIRIDGTNTTANPGITGSDTDTGLQFGTNEVSIVTGGSTRATVDSSGKLGVATTSPQSKLSVGNAASTDDGLSITFTGDDTVVAKYYANTSSGEVTIGGVATNYFPTFYSSGSEAMRLDSDGQLQIGTTSGTGELNVASGGDAAIDIICDSDNNGSNNWPILNFRRNSTTGTPAARIYQQEANNALIFDNNGSERVRILSEGYTHISNNTSDSQYFGNTLTHLVHQDTDNRVALIVENSGNSTPSGIFIDFSDGAPDNNTEYFITGEDSSTVRFRIWSDGDIDNHDNSYGAISDEKLKQDVVDAGSQWDDLKDLRVRKFKFKSDVAAYGDEAKTLIGLVAQEAETVCPNLVKDNPDLDEEGNDLGTVTKSVRYSVLYMKAVKALQEAQTRIETLESQYADLLARVTALEATE